ncbi:MAG: class I SAM-dependent methyltransferase [Clostridia bacterium]|nr:class I SAM-dependent methyltransferase [Clostridia bacterium]
MSRQFENIHQALACAYIRGVSLRTGAPSLSSALLHAPLDTLSEDERLAILTAGQDAQLRLYRFKPHDDLPRVRMVMGFLKSVQPESLLDIGSGRGVFLNEFLTVFPWANVTSLDILDHRVQALADIAAGGIPQLTALHQDLCTWDAPDDSFDVVTLLEVLEHIEDVQQAIRSAVRLARRFVIVTVPSKADDNPEHIHLLTKPILTGLFHDAGCTSLTFSGVPGHLFMIARIDS